VARVKGIPVDQGEQVLSAWVSRQMWAPEYRPLRKVKAEGSSKQARGLLGVGRRGSLVGELVVEEEDVVVG